jgi:DNA end-binding protein Ku
MAPRPIWTGYLRLSLVSCPIRLYPATSRSEHISLHLLNPRTHSRVNMRPHDAETSQELERSELVRGYEFTKGRYIILTENELEAIDLQLSRTIDLKGGTGNREPAIRVWKSSLSAAAAYQPGSLQARCIGCCAY